MLPSRRNRLTGNISGCVDNGLPEFPWEDLEDLWSGEFPPANVELGTGRNGFGRANNCPISQCSNLVPFVDIPLTPPLNQQGPSYGRYDYAGPNVTDFAAPINCHIQGIMVRTRSNCGQTLHYMAIVSSVDVLTSRSVKQRCLHSLSQQQDEANLITKGRAEETPS